jgi:hypothetical protein
MTTTESERISQIYAARGYLVIARYKFNGPCEIGEILTNVYIKNGSTVSQPLRVVAETTQQDFIDQGHYFEGTVCIDPEYDKFYRVESD